eukprot:GCRY01002036.1.p1 GENE.GCRY01002036.1~~GCRY01002036.1.p1  ORF type:complete len:261 (-),score=14.89 GCRY01002036.1:301-1008(-)
MREIFKKKILILLVMLMGVSSIAGLIQSTASNTLVMESLSINGTDWQTLLDRIQSIESSLVQIERSLSNLTKVVDVKTRCTKDKDGVVVGNDCVFEPEPTDTYSWPNARLLCAHLGGNLLHIFNAEEQNLINAWRDLSANRRTMNYWMAANDLTTEGRFVWPLLPELTLWEGKASGTSPNGFYTNWNPAEPNDSSGADCGLYYSESSGYYWDDNICSRLFGALCRIPLPLLLASD